MMTTPGINLLDLPRGVFPRILEYLSIKDLARSETWCQSVRKCYTPIVWEYFTQQQQQVPHELLGGPAMSFSEKERLRRWKTAQQYVEQAVYGILLLKEQQRKRHYQGPHPVFVPLDEEQVPDTQTWEYVPTIALDSFHHCDFFVSFLRLEEFQDDVFDQVAVPTVKHKVLCHGFVPPDLHTNNADNCLIRLLLDNIFCAAADNEPQRRLELFQNLCDPDLFSTDASVALRAKGKVKESALKYFLSSKISIVAVNEMGECNLVISECFASPPWTQCEFVRDPYNAHRFTFTVMGLKEHGAVLQEQSSLVNRPLRTSIHITTTRLSSQSHPTKQGNSYLQTISVDIRYGHPVWILPRQRQTT